MTVNQKMIDIRLESTPITSVDSKYGDRCMVSFTGRVQEEPGLLGIRYELSEQYMYDTLSRHLCKDTFQHLFIVHRVGFVPVGEVTSIISLSTQSDHVQCLDLLKTVIDHIKKIVVHKTQIYSKSKK